ncbi:MAG: major royal jelly family protein [Cytophagales bacterium]|nr:major royal jelly family protein [Cytophagales bacterium]
MTYSNWKSVFTVITLFLFLSCGGKKKKDILNNFPALEDIASSPRQWTGVGVSKEGRIFVNFPRWSDDVPVSVAEIVGGKPVPYPNAEWNRYQEDNKHFLAVQSVYVDRENRLWVLDPANPEFRGVVSRGPRLFRFDLSTNKLVKSYRFPEKSYSANSYLNDVRIDTGRQYAFITDSGTGGLLVLNLITGEVNRVLDGHFSAMAETDSLKFENGTVWRNRVHSDGIALSPDNRWLYYIPLTGHTLYRVPVESLVNRPRSAAKHVEKVGKVKATDGMLFTENNELLLGGLESNSIYKLDSLGNYKLVIQDDRIAWADSFAAGKDGEIYFTTSQIHIPVIKREQYFLYKINL